MKYPILLLFLLCSLMAKAQSWVWARGSAGMNDFYDMATDDSGNVYVTGLWGDYYGSSIFKIGSFTFTQTDSNYYIFVAKYNSSGNVLWAKSFRTYYPEDAYVACDNSGNAFLAGNFVNPLPFVIGSDTLTGSGGMDGYIIKFSPTGNVLWKKKFGGSAEDGIGDIATDKDGNPYITGSFVNDTIYFASDTLMTSVSTFFIAKFDGSGAEIWARQSTNNSNPIDGMAISIDSIGDMYAAGIYSSTTHVKFGAIDLDTSNLSSIFLLKYDNAGNPNWARKFETSHTPDSYPPSITSDFSGNIYITWLFGKKTILGNGTLINRDSTGSTPDIAIAKYNGSGQLVWAKSGGSKYSDRNWGIDITYTGQLILTGGFGDGFGDSSLTFGNVTIPASTEPEPMFIITFDTSGYALCGDLLSSGGDDWNDVVSNKHGDIYIGGDYAINPFILGTDTFHDGANAECTFVGKYIPCAYLSVTEPTKQNSKPLLYPNPSTGIFTIEIQNTELLRLNITNLLGENVYSKDLQSNNGNIRQQMDLSYLPKGIYIYKLYSNTETIGTGKILIQ